MSKDRESSLILATKYGEAAAKLIRSISKNLALSIYVALALAIFAALDVTGIMYYLGMPSEHTHDVVVSIISLILIGLLIPLLLYVTRARKILNAWEETFERNSIKAGISISMSNRSKEEALFALSESITEIGEVLKEHLKKEGYSKFIDVRIDDLTFDVLLDHERSSGKLKEVIREYGSIIIKLADLIDADTVKLFHDSLLKYRSLTGNSIGLAIIIGREVREDTHDLSTYEKDIGRLLLIEKA